MRIGKWPFSPKSLTMLQPGKSVILVVMHSMYPWGSGKDHRFWLANEEASFTLWIKIIFYIFLSRWLPLFNCMTFRKCSGTRRCFFMKLISIVQSSFLETFTSSETPSPRGINIFRVRTVMENPEKSWNLKMVIYSPGKVMEKTLITKVLKKSWKFVIITCSFTPSSK